MHRVSAPHGLTLYEDVKTGALYRKPGRGRVPVTLGLEPAAAPAAVEQQLQKEVKKSNDELRAEFLANQQTLIKENVELKERVGKIHPAWNDYLDNFRTKFRVGALVYADYSMYPYTGWGPQYLENVNPPGPGNNLYNTFDSTRAYLNFYFNPTPDRQLRITPDVYKTFGAATPTGTSRTSAVSSNLSGNLGYRLKYTYRVEPGVQLLAEPSITRLTRGSCQKNDRSRVLFRAPATLALYDYPTGEAVLESVSASSISIVGL